jgi:pSer/pThr/pTyr-binding forkhead associated (FHA) protein
LPDFLPPNHFAQEKPFSSEFDERASAFDSFDEDADDDGKTRIAGALDIDKLNIPESTFMLQLFGKDGQWLDWEPIFAGRKVGRAKDKSDKVPGLNTLAERHLKFGFDRKKLYVEDLSSLNGVYVRIREAVQLTDGLRFRIGKHVLEFHEAEAPVNVEPWRSEDGEVFSCADLTPLAYVNLLRPDGNTGLRFPITKQTTVIGREYHKNPKHELVTISLTGDMATSVTHARLVQHDGKFYLDDLRSTNGTYLQILGPCLLESGDELMVGSVRLRVMAISSHMVARNRL